MPDPENAAEETALALKIAQQEALAAVAGLGDELAISRAAEHDLERFLYPLPEQGVGVEAALAELTAALDAAPRSSGPRWFGFVTGGATPAAIAGDWLATALDQNAALWIHSPLAAQLEKVSLSWLKEMFGLPQEWAGVLTDGATMANFVGLTAARRWWGEKHGVNVDVDGFSGLEPVPIFASDYLHSSVRKALGLLGLGRDRMEYVSDAEGGAFDLPALERRLRELDGEPAILLATAGEVNAGRFDPIDKLAALCERYPSWLHVDGAFGLFARLSTQTAELAAGIERAHSVASDAHKWLNVPYDCGFAFARDPDALRRSLSVLAPYLDQRHLALARRVAGQVDASPDLERLAETPLNIVCFRFRPPGVPEDELDDLNLRLEKAIQEDGRIFVGTTRQRGRVAFRPAILNWRMRERDVDLIVGVVRELGHSLHETIGEDDPAP
jgi:glutamate/tyrosine decarboxylase-like PLP-dependent enzyme